MFSSNQFILKLKTAPFVKCVDLLTSEFQPSELKSDQAIADLNEMHQCV